MRAEVETDSVDLWRTPNAKGLRASIGAQLNVGQMYRFSL